MIHFVVPGARGFALRYFLDDWAGPAAARFRIVAAEQFLRERVVPGGTFVFAVDEALPAERRGLVQVWEQLARAGPGVRLLNHPARAMGRYELLHVMHASGRNRFQAIRATEPRAALRFPVFVRAEREHTGTLTPLLSSPRELSRALAWLALRGYRRSDLLIVEHCDAGDGTGMYRKYSAYIVGDRIIPRCVDFSDRWMVKFQAHLYDRERAREEQAYVKGNPHESWLREVFAGARVDYGRVDYGLCDGVPQVWEINLNPTIGRGCPREQESAELLRSRELRLATNTAFHRAFLAAWEALDAPSGADGEIPIAVEPRLLDAIVRERAAEERRQRWRALVGRLSENTLLAPLTRLVKPAVLRAPSPRTAPGRTGRADRANRPRSP